MYYLANIYLAGLINANKLLGQNVALAVKHIKTMKLAFKKIW
jgi:hypothetical protein